MVDWFGLLYRENFQEFFESGISFCFVNCSSKEFLMLGKEPQHYLSLFFFRTSAGSSSPEKRLPPEENSANMLVEQIQELIEFLANRFEIMTFVF